MKVVISQPFYLPWPGLFDQIRLADVFIHYDDVQLPQGRSFCSRVQLMDESGISWLTVPIVGESRGLINEARIDYSQNWKERHLYKIKKSLSAAPFYDDVICLTEEKPGESFLSLAELNIFFIESISRYLGLSTTFLRSSRWGTKSKSTEKLLELCSLNKATQYITGHGAKNYLDHELFERNGIDVQYMNYQIQPYQQLYGDFTPYVTVLDLIANTGPGAIKHLQSKTISWREFLNE